MKHPLKMKSFGLVVVFLMSCSQGTHQNPNASSQEDRSPNDEGTSLGIGPSRVSLDRRGSAEANANGHLNGNRDQLGSDTDHGFQVTDVVLDADGKEHVRFDRKYKGLRVLGGDVVVHSGADKKLNGMDKAFNKVIRLDVSNPISPEQALAVAEKQFTGMLQTVSKPELIVFARDGDARLAYEIVFTGIVGEETPTEMHVFVDARSSELINQWEGIQTVAGSGNGFFVGSVALETLLASGSYQLKDPNRGNQATNDMANKTNGSGKIFLDADNKWASGLLSDRATVGVDAQFGAATTWDFFKLKFGRLGLRNDGVGALSRVHYGRAYNNAYWSDACFCMTYGDGDGKTFNPFASLDVAGHEMSHGLTAMTAKLVYSGESGGLNEATSDIFGTLVEYFANNQKDVPDYLIGEQLYKSGGGKALRYMYNPPLDGRSPGCYSTTLGTLDVHYSSGVANHFFYLLAEGSTPAGLPVSPTCNGSSLSGIGRDAAGAIWYRALTVYMTSSTNYAGARAATLQAARDLFGSTSSQALAVASAWSAVGVN